MDCLVRRFMPATSLACVVSIVAARNGLRSQPRLHFVFIKQWTLIITDSCVQPCVRGPLLSSDTADVSPEEIVCSSLRFDMPPEGLQTIQCSALLRRKHLLYLSKSGLFGTPRSTRSSHIKLKIVAKSNLEVNIYRDTGRDWPLYLIYPLLFNVALPNPAHSSSMYNSIWPIARS